MYTHTYTYTYTHIHAHMHAHVNTWACCDQGIETLPESRLCIAAAVQPVDNAIHGLRIQTACTRMPAAFKRHLSAIGILQSTAVDQPPLRPTSPLLAYKSPTESQKYCLISIIKGQHQANKSACTRAHSESDGLAAGVALLSQAHLHLNKCAN